MNIASVVLQYYEELRSYALGHRNALMMPLGIDLFMKRGTMAWMLAWNEYKANKIANINISSSITEKNEVAIPQVIQPEIIILLANMILSCGDVS